MWNVKYVVKTPGDMDDMNSTFDFKEEAIEYAQKLAKPGEEVSVEAVEIETDRYGSVVNAGERSVVWSSACDLEGGDAVECSLEEPDNEVKFSDEDLITEAFDTAKFKAACPALADCRDATVAKVVGAYAKDMGINKAEADVAEFKEWFETTSVANFIVDYLEEIGSLQAVADLGIHDEGFMKACKAMAKDMGIIDEEGHDVFGNDGTVMKDLDLIFWAIDSEIDPVNGVKALKKYITEGCEMEESINKAEINKEVDKKHCADNDTENMTLNEAAEDLDDITEDIYIKAIISDDDCEGGECSRDYERAFFDSDFNEFQTEFGDIEGCDKVCDTMPDFSDHVEIETERPDICDDVVTCDVWPEVDSKDTIHGGYVGEKPAEVDAEHKVEKPFDVEDDEFPEVEDEVKEFKPKAPYAFEDEFGEDEDEKEEEDDKDSDDDSDDEEEAANTEASENVDVFDEDFFNCDFDEEPEDEWPEPAEYEAKEARAYHAGDFDYSDIEDVDESVNRSEANAPVEKKHCADNDSENLTLNESDDEELGEEFCNELYDKLHEKRDGVEEGVCKRHKIITHSEDEEPVDCFGEKKPLDKPLTENEQNSVEADCAEAINIKDDDSVTESLKEDLSKDLNDWQKYVEHLQSEIEKAEAALKGEKNEMIKASTQKKIDAMKAELEEAMPNVLKDAAVEEVDPEAATDLPAPAEAELDATDNVAAEEPAEAPAEEPVEAPVAESLTEDADEDVTDKVYDIIEELGIDYDGDADSDLLVKKDDFEKLETKLREAGIDFETQDYDWLSRDEAEELPDHLKGYVHKAYIALYDFSKDDLDESVTDPDLAE